MHSPCDILYQATHSYQTKKKGSESANQKKSQFSLGVNERNSYITRSRAITCACTPVHTNHHVLDQLIPSFLSKVKARETDLRFGRYDHFCVTRKSMRILGRFGHFGPLLCQCKRMGSPTAANRRIVGVTTREKNLHQKKLIFKFFMIYLSLKLGILGSGRLIHVKKTRETRFWQEMC